MSKLNKAQAEFAVNELETAIIEATHKLANEANQHYVNRLKAEMVQFLIGSDEDPTPPTKL